MKTILRTAAMTGFVLAKGTHQMALRAGSREYRPIFIYMGLREILDFEFDHTI
jgi:hypothetical protein